MSADDGYPIEYSIHSAAQQHAARAAADAADVAYLQDDAYHRIDELPRTVFPPLAASSHLPSVPGTPARQGFVAHNSAENSLDPEAAAMHELHHTAIRFWSLRVKVAFCLHMITALCLLRSYYWFTTVIGVVCLIAIWLFAYSIKMKQTTFVLMYLVIVVVNLVKNAMVLLFYFKSRNNKSFDDYDIFLVVLLLIDVVGLTPMTFYSAFWLYRSVALTHLTF